MTGAETAAGAAAAGGSAVGAGLTGAQWAALIASLAGTGASMAAQQQQQQDRRDILNRQAEKTKEAETKSADMVLKEGESYQADARAAAMAGQEQATYDQSQKDLGAAPTIIEGAGDAGNVSKDYLAAKADTALSEGKRLTAIAKELAKTRAPGQLQTTEGLRRSNLAGSLQDLWGTANRGAQAARMDAENVSEPWWGTAGKLVSAGAGAYGASLPAASGAASGANYGLSGARLGENVAQPTFWNNAGQIRFGRG